MSKNEICKLLNNLSNSINNNKGNEFSTLQKSACDMQLRVDC